MLGHFSSRRAMNLARKTVLCALLAASVVHAEKRVLQPAHMLDDFSGNSLGQWACYPAVQDVGYNPSLSPTNEFGALDGRSLMRVVRPVSTGRLRFGFIKKLGLVAGRSVGLSFSYRLIPAESAASIEIGLVGDTRPYLIHVQASPATAWSQAKVQFRDVPSGTNLEALYITVTYEHGNPDIDYRFLIDNVSVEAERAAEFQIQTPRSTAISPWKSRVSAVTYAPGETIHLAASAPVPLAKVSCVLADQDGHRIVSRDLKLDGGLWIDPSLYTVRNDDPTGVWHASLRGATADGSVIVSDLRILVRPPRSDIHPTLYFGPNERAALVARTEDPALGPVWNQLRSLAERSRNTGGIAQGGKIFQLLDARFLLPTLPGYFDVLNRASDRLLYNSLDAYVTADPQARSVAKAALLEIARWETWTPPWFEAHGQHTYYPAGELATTVAFAYDLLYQDLSGSERNLVQRALTGRIIEPVYREYVLDNRIMVNTSNWIGHTVGGAILAALAISQRDDNEELNTYLGGLLMKLEDHMSASYLSDGSYGEGVSYQEFDLKTLTLALTALQRVYGIDYWNRTYVKDSLKYPLFTLAQPTRDSLDMGDTHPPAGYSLAAILQHSRDPVQRWYYDRFEHRSVADFLFPPADVVAQPPSQPVSRIFDQKGNAVFRTGWGPDDAILLYRAGPNFNHNHADQGEFLLRAFGENLATEAGYTDYYKDPYYANYFSQAPGHNTVLIDGDPASQQIADTPQFRALASYPRITDSVTTDSYDALGSELASVYQDKLKSYTRRIVFLKPRYVVIYDDIMAVKPQTRFDWLLHVEDRNRLELAPTGALYRGAKAAMAVRILQPESQRLSVEDGHLPVALFTPVAPETIPAQPGVLDIASRASESSTRFLIVLTLGRASNEMAALNSAVQGVAGDGCSGVQIGDADVLFRQHGSPYARYGDWRTDAQAWTVGGSLISGELVTSMTKAGKIVFASDHPVSFAARVESQRINLVVTADMPALVRFYTGFQARVAAGRTEFALNR